MKSISGSGWLVVGPRVMDSFMMMIQSLYFLFILVIYFKTPFMLPVFINKQRIVRERSFCPITVAGGGLHSSYGVCVPDKISPFSHRFIAVT